MSDFAAAAKQADEQRLPVVEGFTVRVRDGADATTAGAASAAVQQVLTQWLGGVWTMKSGRAGWLIATPISSPQDAAGPPPNLPLGAAWDAVRALTNLPDVEIAEPLLFIRTADSGDAASVASAAMNTRLGTMESPFGLWGAPYSAARKKALRQAGKSSDWALTELKVKGPAGAWDIWRKKHTSGAPGEGIKIAHPDTGYTRHEQIFSHLIRRGSDNSFGVSFLDAGKDALDDLKSDSLGEFPGHGTGTASVIVSPSGYTAPADTAVNNGNIYGVAPGATLLPLRVSTSVVHLSFERLCSALEVAIDEGLHVVSMSLGGPAVSQRLIDIIDEALDKGIIVCAAAGNYLPTVVFPAALPGVVGVAASNALNMAWHFTGFGEAVTVTAPGEQVWRATASLNSRSNPEYATGQGDGTSFAVAHVAGLAALWLSYHGRDSLLPIYKDSERSLLAFAFHWCLTESAAASEDLPSPGFGAGLAQADKLLKQELPDADVIKAYREKILARRQSGLIGITLAGFTTLLRIPTLAERAAFAETPEPAPSATPDPPVVKNTSRELLKKILDADFTPTDIQELTALAGTDQRLKSVFTRALTQKDMTAVELIPLRRYLLTLPLSQALQSQLTAAQKANEAQTPHLPADTVRKNYDILRPRPAFRHLRVYGFDPSLATQLSTTVVNQVTVQIPYEKNLMAGPVGEYLEVVDVDPASNACYEPVDLNHPDLLAQDGLPWSEGNPQFHQQMTYAVAMKTIHHFETALGRPIFWSALRPWKEDSGDADRAASRRDAKGNVDLGDQFLQRLRLYPHALREPNAYYSPPKRAILFGYFPAINADAIDTYPNGMVFTCLSHDIIAHEMTHALLDGMHAYFTEPTNPDVFAFHEGFADIIALMQHFTYPEVVRHELANTRGDLSTDSLLANLALQFGLAQGRHQALRSALGAQVLQRRTASPDGWEDVDIAGSENADGNRPVTIDDAARNPQFRLHWRRFRPDPTLYATIQEPHARGSILVAALFDAFLAIYNERVADLIRIATGGTGVLVPGRLHPDLVDRLADEAAKTAEHVLHICIRAMDYVPPIDITYGEFLRALITADYEQFPDDRRHYRVAFVESFRKWGIFPRDVRTLSEESLRWRQPPPGTRLFSDTTGSARDSAERLRRDIRHALLGWAPGKDRRKVFEALQNAQKALNGYLWNQRGERRSALLHDLGPKNEEDNSGAKKRFSVANMRPSRRIGPNGEFLTEIVFEVVQQADPDPETNEPENASPFRGGVTLIVSLDDWQVRYVIWKPLCNAMRRQRQRTYESGGGMGLRLGAAEYSCKGDAPANWEMNRNTDREAMRYSSCNCSNRVPASPATSIAEPFALLHQGEA